MGEFCRHGLAVCFGFQLLAQGGDLRLAFGSGLTQRRERSIEIPLSLRRCHLTNGPAKHVPFWLGLLGGGNAARGDDCRKHKQGQPADEQGVGDSDRNDGSSLHLSDANADLTVFKTRAKRRF